MALRYRKNQYVKLATGMTKHGPVKGMVKGDVMKVLLVGPFIEGDVIIIDKTNHKFVVGTPFHYWCEVSKQPDCYIALDEDDICPLDFRLG